MARYILIDEHSGFVWGDIVAADPIAACRTIDEGFGEHGRIYKEIGHASFDGCPGYRVHEAPADFLDATGNWDEALMAVVAALPLVERVAVTGAEG